MTAKEIREAAILLHDYFTNDSMIEPEEFDIFTCYPESEQDEIIRKDIVILSKYILANVPEDGDEPVDEDWLREEWGFECHQDKHPHDGDAWKHPNLPDTFLSHDGGYRWSVLFVSWCGEAYYPQEISTRSQFRSLMAGLGIEPKKYLKKI